MSILVINSGSSSIKYKLFDKNCDHIAAYGIVGRIGEKKSFIELNVKNKKFTTNTLINGHKQGLELIIKNLKEYGLVKDLSEISAVGHRVVHGGNIFFEPTLLTKEVIKKIEQFNPLAPLHNPANLKGIEIAMKLMPEASHVAVFDTSFHQTIPQKAYLYSLPYEYYEKYKIRRYGFHGISCRYVSKCAANLLQTPLDHLRMIVCHLGNGVTVTAVNRGISVDTSMGMTPLEGLMMGTRSGDIDPGVLLFLERELGFDHKKIDNILNKKSGLLGISGISNDVRDIIKKCKQGNKRCKLAIEIFSYRIKKYIGAYAAVLNGIDALVFTAGIGENSARIRELICKNLGYLGLFIDKEKNTAIRGSEGIISTKESSVKVMVIPTSEEKMIALETYKLLKKNSCF